MAPATQKGGGVTNDHGPGSHRNFSEASKILHLPHKKNVRPRRTSRRHRKFRVGTGVGEVFQSDKITLWTDMWLYWGGLGF